MADVEDARTIGLRVRQVRNARGKSLRVVAGLAGISSSHLHRIETGERALDSIKQIVALANALGIAPSELQASGARARQRWHRWRYRGRAGSADGG